MFLLATLLPHQFAESADIRRVLFTRFPLWLMLLISLVNGIFEELLARGFAIERLSEVTHSTFIGATIAFALNLAVHLPYRGWRPTVVLIPGLGVFLALYLWRRSVIPCAIGHILNDAFPFVVAAITGVLPTIAVPYLSYHRQAAIYYTKGDFDRSIHLFTLAIARNQSDTYAYDWRGLAWLNKQDYAKAFADFAEAIRIDPKYGTAYGDQAFGYIVIHDRRQAIASLDHAIALQPDGSNWYEMRAQVESSSRDQSHAVEDYRRAIRLDPSNGELYGELANVDYYRGDFAAAIKDYSALVHFVPNRADAWVDLAMAYTAAEDYDRAIDALAHALKIDPSSAYAYRGRAAVREAQHKYDLAFADVNRAIALDANNPDGFGLRAELRVLRDKDDAGALADLAKAIALAPTHSDLFVQQARVHARRTIPPRFGTTTRRLS